MKKINKLIFILCFMFLISLDNVKAEDTKVVYQTHIQDIGWQEWTNNGNISGTEGQSKRLEAIRINLENRQYSGDIVYQTHIQDIGWQEWTNNGNISGTEGQSKRLEAIRINLTGELAEHYDIYYSVHVQNFGWLGWAKNGEASGTAGYSYRLEGIKIIIAPKGGIEPGHTFGAYYEKEPSINYQTHIQDIGWQGYVGNDSISGTEGQSKRLESIIINLDNGVYWGNISYQTHVQDIGWQEWTNNGNMSGTEGQSKRLEAIKIKLNGDIANYYDIYYRVHIENIGWTGWTANGEPAGSEGYSYRLEAIQIRLIKRGNQAPEIDNNAFYLKPQFVWYYENGVKNLYNNTTGLIGKNVKKIIDVSSHNKVINWDKVKYNSDVDGVILRLGYGSYSEDSQFARNISELKRLNIPYGIYLFSYAENSDEALAEANFTLSKIRQYDLNPTLGIYYDIEDWHIGNYYQNISSNDYNSIISTYINYMINNGYNSNLYTYTRFANFRLSDSIKNNISWIAQYNNYCNYNGYYKMWQYTSGEKINGIDTNVDVSVMFN